MKKILFIVHHRLNRSPGQRFRFEHHLNYLKDNGFSYKYSNLLSKWDDKIFYSKGNYILKTYILIKSIFIRFVDFFRAFGYDYVFIYREAFMLGTTFFERLYKLTGAKLIFDFDDAIWFNDTSDGNKDLIWLKNPNKYGKIIKLSDIVFAGNNFLADYALQFNKNVMVMPTVINTNYHRLNDTEKNKNKVCIGWTGSSTTLKHFETAIPFLKKIKTKYPDKVYFKVIVNMSVSYPELDLVSTNWNIDSEIEDLAEFDIGIMPLPNDNWSKGKCGFKGIQYMSLEIPTIMSPVGVNAEIITNGINGYLASDDDEWINKLSILIENPEMRARLGKAGYQTVLDKYSVESQKDKYLTQFNNFSR